MMTNIVLMEPDDSWCSHQIHGSGSQSVDPRVFRVRSMKTIMSHSDSKLRVEITKRDSQPNVSLHDCVVVKAKPNRKESEGLKIHEVRVVGQIFISYNLFHSPNKIRGESWRWSDLYIYVDWNDMSDLLFESCIKLRIPLVIWLVSLNLSDLKLLDQVLDV